MAMFSFVDKIKEAIFKGKNKQEKRDRKASDEYIGKIAPVKRTGYRRGVKKTRNHNHPLWDIKPGRKIARKRIFGGAAERALARAAFKRLQAKNNA